MVELTDWLKTAMIDYWPWLVIGWFFLRSIGWWVHMWELSYVNGNINGVAAAVYRMNENIIGFSQTCSVLEEVNQRLEVISRDLKGPNRY